MHLELNGTLVLKRTLVLVSLIAAVFAVSCDRDSPTQPTREAQESFSGGETNTGTVTFSARATGATSTVLGTKIGLCSATLPPQGGEDGTVVFNGRIPGTLQAMFFHSIVSGSGDRCGAQANSGDLDVMVGGQRIQCHLVSAGAEAICVSGTATVRGASYVSDLRINGKDIPVSGQANQTIWLPLGLGRVVINEQIKTASSMTIRGLHIVVAGAAEVAISEAQAGITCGQPDCDTPCDFVTGGGWITGTPSGAKGTFGVSGGIRNGSSWGHLAYIDHGPGGPKVKGTGVTSYTIVSSTMRHIEGTCEVNGQAGYTYRVDVADNGEPGTSDMFRIQLSNGYTANGTLGGGNIQLHTPCK